MLGGSTRRLEALRHLAAEEPVHVTVKGDCMEPILADGHRIALTRRRMYWPGDIVAFRSAEGRLLVHRVLAVVPTLKGWLLFAQGDARSRPDNPVSASSILGRCAGGRENPVRVRPRDRGRATLRFGRHLARLVTGRWPSQSPS